MDERKAGRAGTARARVKGGTLVRATAAATVDRITRTGAYSNIVVHTTDLSDLDRSAHQNLVFTTLRWMIPVDSAIEASSTRSLSRTDPKVLSVLRVAATEMHVLEHSPHGVVDGAVDAIGELGVPRAKGYVNAVARKLATMEAPALSASDTFPTWMHRRIGVAFGDPDQFFASLNEATPPGLRARSGQILAASAVEGIEHAYYANELTDMDEIRANDEIDVIDPASSAVARALDVHPNDVVADLAAAPGGKTRAIADRLTGSGWIVASDRHRGRTVNASQRSSPQEHIGWIQMDARSPALRPRAFNRVLLDAPCTGLGTVRRRPEIRHRIDERAPERYGEMQRAMLVRSLRLVAPGGRLVYSVCTFFTEETVDVVAGLGGRAPDMSTGDVMGDGRMLTPLNAGTDGMFISVFDR